MQVLALGAQLVQIKKPSSISSKQNKLVCETVRPRKIKPCLAYSDCKNEMTTEPGVTRVKQQATELAQYIKTGCSLIPSDEH
jgi:hypothetical protein